MNKERMFLKRGDIGRQILQFIKGEGYTKSSFAKMIDLSRPTLNKIIEGDIPSETTFETHINKILQSLSITLEDLINYKNPYEVDTIKVAYSNNSPKDYVRSKNAINTLDILDSVLDLYEIYYK